MKETAPCKYFSNISLYPNTSRLPGENRTLRHSRMNTVFHWKVEFNKYLKETKILKQNKKPRVIGYRFAECKTADAIVHPWGQLCTFFFRYCYHTVVIIAPLPFSTRKCSSLTRPDWDHKAAVTVVLTDLAFKLRNIFMLPVECKLFICLSLPFSRCVFESQKDTSFQTFFR